LTTEHTLGVVLVKLITPPGEVALNDWSSSVYFIATGAVNAMAFLVATGLADFVAVALVPRLLVARICTAYVTPLVRPEITRGFVVVAFQLRPRSIEYSTDVIADPLDEPNT